MNFILLGILVVLILIALSGFRVIYQFERGVVFTFGKFSGIKDPGLVWVVPLGIQAIQKVDMRIKTVDIPRQEIITKDNISVMANAVVYYKVVNAEQAIIKIQNVNFAMAQYTQAALRDAVGNQGLDVILSERVKIGDELKSIVSGEAKNWGIEVDAIRIQEVELPQDLKRAMAKQAEAERERRAMIISSDGELQASKNLQEAAEILARSPAAIHLRTLQTMRDISTNPSQKIVVFMPSDISKLVGDLVK
ncbi:MAG: slipin family protein [Alphaproteobacteria bacterium]|jgi:regulator of protease activity HflC (stomatin/prohibitin superfamily)|nr:slipin family protein [Alphaproteobacteria bacterium]